MRAGVLVLVAATLFAGAAWGAAPAPEVAQCPPALLEEAELYRAALEVTQRAVRESGPTSPLGVEETVQFDKREHSCHRGPGQAYRVFDEPACLPARPDGRVPVRFPYRLFFRKALTLDALFEKEWKPGSDGILQVQFAR